MSDIEPRDPLSQAGQDPDKRLQILAGAREVFLERGFDAASMGDIARTAGVSKGTLYVYFEDKVDLFTALVTSECAETAERTFVLDTSDQDIEAALNKLGHSFIEAMVRPSHIATVRTVIAIAGKFPEIGRRFFEAGPCEGIKRLSAFLRIKVAEGVLEIDDVEIAASQFFALCKDAVTTPILIGCVAPPDCDYTRRVVRKAVDFFLCVYGAEQNAARRRQSRADAAAAS
ncbi:TetR/AcrR family transcriptional regulator [Aquabacter spiritensis]|uniref:TetR family transcriptional regulator n=1 Tax=Aquabacter spiritensis TaxID=933073 RepID=A0A4R3M1Z9_9HYPH|nr:TetR/AcrR family transcriptional regulator [Aquabacter spiritensis]TCT05207.1 TetR family transcriptional regulator [Aquabacter spiritensis]